MNTWTVEFLDETVEAEFDQFPTPVKAKVIHISKLIGELGLPNVGMPYLKHVQGKIWEIRAVKNNWQGRCLYVTAVGKKIFILRCFIKKSQKLPQKELNLAQQRAGRIHE